MKQEQIITVFEQGCSHTFPTTPIEFMRFWSDKIELVPIEFIASAKIYVENYDNDINVRILYTCPETDKEERIREARLANTRATREERELETLARLKAKYEGTNE